MAGALWVERPVHRLTERECYRFSGDFDAMADVVSLPLDAARYRADFPILAQTIHEHQQLIYLDNAASSQSPRQVVEQWEQVYYQYYSNVHPNYLIHLILISHKQ